MDFSKMDNNLLLQIVADVSQVLSGIKQNGISKDFWYSLYKLATKELDTRFENGSI